MASMFVFFLFPVLKNGVFFVDKMIIYEYVQYIMAHSSIKHNTVVSASSHIDTHR